LGKKGHERGEEYVSTKFTSGMVEKLGKNLEKRKIARVSVASQTAIMYGGRGDLQRTNLKV